MTMTGKTALEAHKLLTALAGAMKGALGARAAGE
jgi:hypothetical protein